MDLFHYSVGVNRDDRYIVVSVFADGFTDLMEAPKNKTQARIHHYSPWYMQNHQSTSEVRSNVSGEPTGLEAERVAQEAIHTLIDQPGECLRDGVDRIDYAAMDDDNLSDIAPPRLENDQLWTLVDTPDKMVACVEELLGAHPSEIAFDVEAYNLSKYAQLTCLLQITSNLGREYVIDTLAPGVWEEVGRLAPLFSDPSIVKIGHSIASLDVRSLHRDFGIFVVNAFDTYEAARVLKIEGLGLASVCEYYGLKCDVYRTLKAEYQTCDWRVRPLTGPMMQYGRYDIRFLVKLRLLMVRDLTRAEVYDKSAAERAVESRIVAANLALTLDKFDDEEHQADETARSDNVRPSEDPQNFFTPVNAGSFADNEEMVDAERPMTVAEAHVLRLQPRLMTVLSRSQESSRKLWSGGEEPPLKVKLLESLIKRAAKQEVDWTETQTQFYLSLVKWRARVAREVGCLPSFVAPLDFFVQVAWRLPESTTALRRLSFDLPELLEEEERYQHILLSHVSILIDSRAVTCTARPLYLFADRPQGPTALPVAWKATLVVGVAASVAFAVFTTRRRGR